MEWLVTNKQWVFDGFGVTLFLLLCTWLAKAFKKKEVGIRPLGDEIAFLVPPTEIAKPPRVLTLLETIPGLRDFAWKRIYTEQEISRRIRVTVRSEGEGMVFWKSGDAGRASVWLDFVNLNPFSLNIDKIAGHITVAENHIAEIKIIDTHKIPSTAWGHIHFDVAFSPTEIQSIEFQLKNRPDASAGASLRIYVNTTVRDITLRATLLTGNRIFRGFAPFVK